jgi:hypothetical protein
MPGKPSKRRDVGGRSDGATWCEQHNRRECAKNTKKGVRCHQIALDGLDACPLHAGESRAKAKARGQANLLWTRFREVNPEDYVSPAQVLSWAVTVAYFDVWDYRAQLAERVKNGETIDAESFDRLMRLEAVAANISKQGHDAKIDERMQQLHEREVEVLVSVIRGILSDLGHDANDPDVQGIVRRRLQIVAGPASA